MSKTPPTSTAERAAAALREQQAAERRRRFVIVGSVVAVLAIIGGLTWFAISRGDTTGEAVDESGVPGNTDGYAVVVGDADAPLTMKFYEDPQCPVCQQFEAAVGEPGRGRDRRRQGEGRVPRRLVPRPTPPRTPTPRGPPTPCTSWPTPPGPRCSRSTTQLLYDNQPAESTAGPDDDQLIEWAVEAGADEDAVRQPIEDKVYEQWIANATDQMSKDGVNGTPGVFIDDQLQPDPGTAVNAVLQAIK